MTRQDTLPSKPRPSRQNGLAFGGLSLAAVRDLLLPQPAPCLTLSLPTHRNVPENRVDLLSYTHLVDSLDMALSLAHPRAEIERLLRPYHQLGTDRTFWEHTRAGLIVFAADGWARGSATGPRRPARRGSGLPRAFTKPAAAGNLCA